MKLTCAIIDDEPLAVELLESYVRKTPFLELKGAYNGGITALEALKTEPVDLLFCDITSRDQPARRRPGITPPRPRAAQNHPPRAPGGREPGFWVGGGTPGPPPPAPTRLCGAKCSVLYALSALP